MLIISKHFEITVNLLQFFLKFSC